MRAKKEKTAFGTVKAVLPKSKKAAYGDVDPSFLLHSSKGDSSSESTGYSGCSEEYNNALEELAEFGGGYQQLEEEASASDSKVEMSPLHEKSTLSKEKQDALAEALKEFLNAKKEKESREKSSGSDSQEKESSSEEGGDSGDNKSDKENGDNSDSSSKDSGGDGDSENQNQENQNQKVDEKLTRYLLADLKLRALGIVFSSELSRKDKSIYYRISHKGKDLLIIPTKGTDEVDFDSYALPTFKDASIASHFNDFCCEAIIEYIESYKDIDFLEKAVLENIQVVIPS